MNIKIDDEMEKKLMTFKDIFDEIMEENVDFDKYVSFMITQGLDKMIRDIIPPEHEWDTIKAAFDADSEFMAGLIRNILLKGARLNKKEKSAMRDKLSIYIQ